MWLWIRKLKKQWREKVDFSHDGRELFRIAKQRVEENCC